MIKDAIARACHNTQRLADSSWSRSLLPILFKPNASFDLMRLGKDHDGGYLVERNAVLSAKSLISFGINKDWSFEEYFVRNTGVSVDAYDHTVTDAFWNDLIETSLHKSSESDHERAKYEEAVTLYREYGDFFSGEHKHYKEKIGSGEDETISVSRALKRLNGVIPTFMKIDIEGSEYEILDSLIENASSISGMVIEFHKLDQYAGTVTSFLEEFPLTLVHTHPNNFGRLDIAGDPRVVELTFARDPEPISGDSCIPHPLDQRNNPELDEIALMFSDSS